MTYKAIVFDLFGTLIENLPPSEYREILHEAADILAVDRKDFSSVWLEYTDERMKGSMNNDDCIDIICRQMNLTLEISVRDAASKAFNDPVERKLQAPFETLNALSGLHEKNIRTGLASNCSHEVLLFWDTSPLALKIQKPVFSCSAGCQKPDPEIYILAADRLGVKPEECIFVDDAVNSLRGAEKTGMMPVLIQNQTLKSFTSENDDWNGYTIASALEMVNLIKTL